tara:strand:- start:643 stop:1173 length:531 start_codon:yes stop_codon:yes gene_type:complete
MLVIEVPRTGMRSLERSLQGHYKKTHVGHYTASRFIRNAKHVPQKIVAVIRDPLDRLLSAVNFACRSLDDVTDKFTNLISNGWDTSVIAPTSQDELHYVFCPQTAYLDENKNYDLIPFLQMQKLYDLFPSPIKPLHTNKSTKWMSLEQLKSHKMFQDVMNMYSQDILLYSKLTPQP